MAPYTKTSMLGAQEALVTLTKSSVSYRVPGTWYDSALYDSVLYKTPLVNPFAA